MKSSYSLPGQPASARLHAFTKPALFAFLLALTNTSIPSRAATAPPATLLYTAPGGATIHGGVASIGTSGLTYLSTLSIGSTPASVVALNLSGTQPKWAFNAPGTGSTYAAALWHNNSVSVPGGCSGSVYLANTYANALNGFGDVVGYYSTSALVWPDGANSSTFYVTLSKSATDGTTYTSANATGHQYLQHHHRLWHQWQHGTCLGMDEGHGDDVERAGQPRHTPVGHSGLCVWHQRY